MWWKTEILSELVLIISPAIIMLQNILLKTKRTKCTCMSSVMAGAHLQRLERYESCVNSIQQVFTAVPDTIFLCSEKHY
jgi:hypothetical protein